jgi:protein-tyrosine phosphatase
LLAADVVLVAEQKHRRAVVSLQPAALGHTFLLTHFARLVAASGIDREASGLDLLAAARAQRGRLQPVRAEDDDIADPAGRSARRLRACAVQIAGAVDLLVGEASS